MGSPVLDGGHSHRGDVHVTILARKVKAQPYYTMGATVISVADKASAIHEKLFDGALVDHSSQGVLDPLHPMLPIWLPEGWHIRHPIALSWSNVQVGEVAPHHEPAVAI